MSRLEELIAELCPNGVEYKALGEIGIFIRGSGLQKKDFTESGVGCIHYGQIYTFYGSGEFSLQVQDPRRSYGVFRQSIPVPFSTREPSSAGCLFGTLPSNTSHGQSPYSGVNSRGKKLSHGNAFGMFGIAEPPKPKGEHHGSGHT